MRSQTRLCILQITLMLAICSLPSGILRAQAAGQATPSANAPKTLPGETVTLLPDGTELLLGGEAQNGSVSTAAAIFDPSTSQLAPLASSLHQARAWQTSTVLPDGTVLVFGGTDSQGDVIGSAEKYDPKTQLFTLLPSTGLTPRANHTATLLTDGLVLIIGGVSSNGETLDSSELWDPKDNSATQVPSLMQFPRRNQSAAILPNGDVLVWGGMNAQGQALKNGESFTPENETFTLITTPPALPDQSEPPRLMGSQPEDGSLDVETDTVIGIRFSEPLQMPSVNASTVTLSSPAGQETATVAPADDGMLAFLVPQNHLQPGVTYTVSLSGLADSANRPLPPTQFQFTTAGLVDSEAWVPQPGDGWKTQRPKSAAQLLPPLQAPPGTTAISGQVLTLDGKPLRNVTLQVEGISTQTDKTGRFLLSVGGMSGKCTLVIDGTSANHGNKAYGLFQWLMDVKPSVTNVLPFTIWMPLLDMEHAVTIPSPTTQQTIVSTPVIPGLELVLPPNTVIKDRNGNVVHQLSITPIPLDRTPFPLPGVQVPIYFTIQPGGAIIQVSNSSGPSGAQLYYPNTYNSPPGTPYDFWDYSPEPNGRWAGWWVYGHGAVASDGKEIIPNPGVYVHKLTGAMIGSTGAPPDSWAPPGGDQAGDPVDLSTGLFVVNKTDLYLPDTIPISVTRTYRPGDPISRAFGVGANFSYGMFLWSVDNYQEADLILADGGRIHYMRISSGTSWTDAVYEHTSTPTIFYGSILTWNAGIGGWDITLKNGTVYTFKEYGPLQYIRDRYGNQVTMTWSNGTGGNLLQVTSPNGRYIKFTYDSSNRIIQAQDNTGRIVQYTYDSGGRLYTVTDPNSGVTTYTYDSSGNMLTIKDARNITYLTNQYDGNGRVTKQTLADSSTYQLAYTLGFDGKVTQTDLTDQRGNVRRETFNQDGYALTKIYALGKPEQQEYTYVLEPNTNLVQSVTDPLGRQTEYTYDNMGNVTSITRLAGTGNAVTTSFSYDRKFSQLSSVTDPLGHATVMSYDDRGNLTSILDPMGNRTMMAYNHYGQPTAVTDPLNDVTRFSYSGGDLTGIMDPLGHSTSRFVDAAGRLISVTSPMGHATVYSYDPLNELTQIKDPLGNTTIFAYDPNGNLLSVKDAKNNITSYTYDDMDQRITRKDPLPTRPAETFQYDANGNLTQFTDQKQQVTTFQYDALNRKTFAGFGTQAGPTYESTITYTYDGGNRLTQAVDSVSGTINLGYDDLNRLTSEDTPQGSVTYTYDNVGRRTSMTVAGQTAVNYSYDNDDRLTAITQGTSTVGFTYDGGSRRATLTLPNGVEMSYGYDQASELTGVTYKMGMTTLGNLTYGYDGDGRRASMGGSLARTGVPQQLNSATYDGANELTQWDTSSLTYDANGNLTGDGVNTYTWDARNQLTSVKDAGTGTTLASFVYGPFGRRIQNSVGNQMLFDGVDAVQELSGTTPVVNRLTGGLDEFFARSDASGTTFPLTDALGSTIALTDATGNIQTQYTYEPFGGTTPSGTTSANWYQFTGRVNDGTGLYYYRARYYSPRYQRFISVDPVGLAGGINPYSYALDSPTIYVDPLGLATVSVTGSINVQFGSFGFEYNGGFAVDSQGNIAIINTGGGGRRLGKGWTASIGTNVSGSNAHTVCGLGGPFASAEGGAGLGPHVSINGFTGRDSRGRSVLGLGVTGGAGVGEGGYVGVTYTSVTPLAGRKRTCP